MRPRAGFRVLVRCLGGLQLERDRPMTRSNPRQFLFPVILSVVLLGTTAFTQTPNLTITKTHTGNVHAGDIGVVFTITVTNSGTAPTNGTVVVADKMPSGMSA